MTHEQLTSAQTELRTRNSDLFVDATPLLPEGSKGVVVPGCPRCRKKIYTIAQFIEHIAVDVLPGLPGLGLLGREPGID